MFKFNGRLAMVQLKMSLPEFLVDFLFLFVRMFVFQNVSRKLLINNFLKNNFNIITNFKNLHNLFQYILIFYISKNR